jgi:hypothetical protein
LQYFIVFHGSSYLFTALCAKGQGLWVILIMTRFLKEARPDFGYFNYGPTFTEVFSGKFTGPRD